MRLFTSILLIASVVSVSATDLCATKHAYRDAPSLSVGYMNADVPITHPQATESPATIPVGFLAEDAPISYTFNGKPDGIAVDLFQHVMQQICFEGYKLILYTSHKQALQDLQQNKIAMILGDFSYNGSLWDNRIESSRSFFVDKDKALFFPS